MRACRHPSAEAIETADEYGRRSGCFLDHRRGQFDFEKCIPLIQTTTIDIGDEGLEDQPRLQDLLPPAEPLSIDDDLELRFADDLVEAFLELPRDAATRMPPLIRGLDIYKKLLISTEPLALATDPETDLREYARDVADKRFGRPFDTWLPLVQMSLEYDESMPSPSRFKRLQSLLQREVENETLALPHGASEILKQLHQPSRFQPPDICEHHHGELLNSMSHGYPEPVTPPIFLSSDDASPFIPMNDGNIIDLTSEPSSPVHEGQAMVQRRLEAAHLSPEPTSPALLRGSSPSRLLPSLRSNSHPSGQTMKLDVPVMETSSDTLCPEHPLTDAIPLFSGPGTSLTPPNEHERCSDDAFMALVGDRAAFVNNLADQEHPDQLASSSRVQVPILDFDIPSPLWTTKSASAKSQFGFLRDDLGSGFTIHPVSRDFGSETSLKWDPVPPKHIPISTKEELPRTADGAPVFLEDVVPTLSSSSFFPPRGMALVKMTEDVEMEVEEIPASPSTISDTEMQPRSPSPCQSRSGVGSRCEKQLGPPPMPAWATLLGSVQRQLLDVDTSYLPKPSDTSATSALVTSFMQLRGKQPKPVKAVTSAPSLQQTQTAPAVTEAPFQAAPMIPAMAPKFDVPEEKRSFIISLGLGRCIISHLEAVWPPTKLIDMDLSRHTGVPEMGSMPALSSEADVVLSPRAGIIVTNLLKVRQRALPGSKILAPLRERIKRVSQKYETLTVLVSESNPLGEFMGNLSSSDAASYAEFVHFVIGLDAGVTVLLVAGAEATLAKWILSLMCCHSKQAAATERFLSAREGPWELFLRQSGLNVAAAKVLSGSLLEDAGPMGLARYMITPVQERMAAYAGVLGEKAIRISSERMDQTWA